MLTAKGEGKKGLGDGKLGDSIYWGGGGGDDYYGQDINISHLLTGERGGYWDSLLSTWVLYYYTGWVSIICSFRGILCCFDEASALDARSSFRSLYSDNFLVFSLILVYDLLVLEYPVSSKYYISASCLNFIIASSFSVAIRYFSINSFIYNSCFNLIPSSSLNLDSFVCCILSSFFTNPSIFFLAILFSSYFLSFCLLLFASS